MDFEKEIFGNSSDDGDNLKDLENENLEEMFASSDDEVYKERVLPSFKKKTTIEKSTEKKIVKKKRPKQQVQEEQVERELSPEEQKREQARQDFDEALEKIKPKGRRRDLRDETEWDEKMSVLLDMMKEAAYQDLEDLKQDKPGLKKMKLLPTVLDNLQKRHLHSQFLDNSILEGIRLWLEPLEVPGAPFPNIKIQKELLLILDSMPIETHHLRSSRIGRIVKHYTINTRIMKDIQAIALKLIDKWIRPIIQRSASYRDAMANRSREGMAVQSKSSGSVSKDIPRAMNEKYRKIQARMRTLQSKR